MRTLTLLSWPFTRNGVSAPSATRWRSGARGAASRHRPRGGRAWLSPPERFAAAIVLEDLASAAGGPASVARIIARYVALRAVLCSLPRAGAAAGDAGADTGADAGAGAGGDADGDASAMSPSAPHGAQPDAVDAGAGQPSPLDPADAGRYLSVLPADDPERAALAAALPCAAGDDGPAAAGHLAEAAELAHARNHRRGAFALARAGFELAEAADPALAASCAALLARLAAAAGDSAALRHWRRREAGLRARVVASPPEL